jgi:hypothetical protein
MTSGLVNIVSNGEGCWTILPLCEFCLVLHKPPCGYPTAYPQATNGLKKAGFAICWLNEIFFEKSQNFKIGKRRFAGCILGSGF